MKLAWIKLVSALTAGGMLCVSGAALPVAAEAPVYVVYDGLRYKESANYCVLNGAADTSVTSIHIPAEVNGKRVLAGGACFRDCPYLTEITADENHGSLSAEDGVLFSQNGQHLIAYPCAKAGAYTLPDSVLCIGDSAFENVTGLTELTFTDNLQTVGMSAFVNCINLTEIHGAVPFTYGNVFVGCESLKSLELAEYGDANGTAGITMFSLVGCTALETVTIPENRILVSDVSVLRCPNLKSLKLPALEDTGWTPVLTVADCGSLTELTLSAVASYVPGVNCHISDCANLRTVTFQAGYLAGVEITDCPALTKAVYLSGEKNCRESTFSGCGDLTVYGLSADRQIQNDCSAQNIPFVPLDGIKGDLNLDTQADVSDAVLLARYLASDAAVRISEIGFRNADLNGDGAVEASDMTKLLKIIAKL